MCNIYNRSNRKGEKNMRENKIILFENQEVKLEVNMKDETVWLSIDQCQNYLIEINLLYLVILKLQ